MPNWSDPLEILKDAEILQKVCLVELGLSTWEIVVSLPFDWSIISRKREVRWPAFFYFYCRYSIWFAVISGNIVLNATTKVNCQALYTFSLFTINTSIGSASTLLMLRTIAVWNRSRLVMVPLVVMALGQWALLLHSITTVHSSWSDIAGVCEVHSVSRVLIEANYIYTMSFDFIVLVLTTIGLVRSPTRSSLWQLLFRQGIIYFLVAFIANSIPTIFLLLDLNTIMNMMFCAPAAVASSIVACRSFVSLTDFRHKDVYIHSAVPCPQRVGLHGSDATHARAGVGSGNHAKGKRGIGNVIAEIAFRSMGASADTIEPYHTDGVNTTTTASAVLDLKPEYDFGHSDENGGVMVHTKTVVREVNGARSEVDVNVDLEKGSH